MNWKILKSKEAQIGALIIGILVLFIWGFNYLKGKNILSPTNYYYCEYSDVGGLMESNFVMVRGFKVGMVENIKLSEDNEHLIVTIVLDDNVKVTKGSKAILYSLDMLGTKAIKLDLKPGTDYYDSGATIPSGTEPDLVSSLSKKLMPVENKITSIIGKIDSISTSLNHLLSDSTTRDLKSSIHSLKATTSALSNLFTDPESHFNHTMYNLDKITASLGNENSGINATMQKINNIADSLASSDLKRTISRVNSTMASLHSVLYKIDNNRGSLGMLLNDKSLYNNLSNSTESLNYLLTDLQNQPSKYIQLSLIDWGKDVYVDENGVSKKIDNDSYSFAVLIKETNDPVAINDVNFNDPSKVNETKHKGHYYYSIGKYKDYASARKNRGELMDLYPSAEIITFKGDKIVPLENALK